MHTTTIAIPDLGIRIGSSPVRQGEWEAVMGSNPSLVKGSRLPVHTVSHRMAEEYCRMVDARLPTEREWVLSCWAGPASDPAGATVPMPAWSFVVSEHIAGVVGRQTVLIIGGDVSSINRRTVSMPRVRVRLDDQVYAAGFRIVRPLP